MFGRLNALNKKSRGFGPHPVERLTDGGETRVEVIGNDDVVEADHRDVARTFDPASSIARMAPMAEVSLKQKIAVKSRVRLKQVADGRIAELRRPDVFFKVDAEFRIDGDSDLFGDSNDGFPTRCGVERVTLAFHESDAAVAEIVEVAKGKARRRGVVEHDVCNRRYVAMDGDADDWKWDVDI